MAGVERPLDTVLSISIRVLLILTEGRAWVRGAGQSPRLLKRGHKGHQECLCTAVKNRCRHHWKPSSCNSFFMHNTRAKPITLLRCNSLLPHWYNFLTLFSPQFYQYQQNSLSINGIFFFSTMFKRLCRMMRQQQGAKFLL